MSSPNNIRFVPKAILLDMDGVLYHGDEVILDAIAFMQSISEIPHCFITNNPILLSSQITLKLDKMGFGKISIKSIVTSGEACALWLSKQKKSFHYYAVGAQGLHDALAKYGIADEINADYVVVGEGQGIDYESLTKGINLIKGKQAKLISTNPDQTVDSSVNGKHVILPGGGALVSPFVIATGQEPVTIGKPYPLLYETALARLNVQADDCLMIGDRPDTDIKGAAQLGMKTALVRTGRFKDNDKWPNDCPKPTWDVANLEQLKRLLFN